ncbi:type B 50S ribosomal protein L31 [Candidatus Saccharibacteria bacterium]|nr:type B 50S ribosomal protein L31 [Candidatus Saccharibacteria bacterium]
MKKDLHPDNYRLVVFQDTSSDFKILTRSTAASNETIKWEDGNEYPLVKVHVSSASHPFFTGEEKVLDIEGRVDKFKARAEAAAKAKEAKIAAVKKTEKKPAKKSTEKKEVTKTSEEVKTDSEK